MNAITKAPSAWAIGRVLEIVREMRERIAQQAAETVDTDDDVAWRLPSGERAQIDPDDVLRRLIRAAIEADNMEYAIDRRIEDLRTRQARYVQRCKEYRASIALVMGALSIDKFTDADATVSLRPNKGGSVIITDEAALPDEYVRTERKPVKAAIREALNDGVVVPGATLSQGGEPVLTIRCK